MGIGYLVLRIENHFSLILENQLQHFHFHDSKIEIKHFSPTACPLFCLPLYNSTTTTTKCCRFISIWACPQQYCWGRAIRCKSSLHTRASLLWAFHFYPSRKKIIVILLLKSQNFSIAAYYANCADFKKGIVYK